MGYSSDVTSTSYAISGGDYSGYSKTNAFDGGSSTYWYSSARPGESDCWIGQDFGSGNAKSIRKFLITQITVEKNYDYKGTLSWYASAVALEYSDDASTWTTGGTFSLNYALSDTVQYKATTCTTSSDFGCHRYWRARATAGSGNWFVSEVEMYTLDTGYAIITVTDSSGNALSGATATVGSVSGTTGSDGTVTLSGLTTGSNAITVSLAGYTTATSTVTIAEGTTATATVVLSAGTVLSVQEV